MSYSTPHHIREYIIGACLAVNHGFCVRALRRTAHQRRDILKATKEIDLCAELGHFFGTTSRLSAQGSDKADLLNDGPPFQTEVKFIFPQRTNWNEVRADWHWLIDLTNAGQQFRRRSLVWFWPSTELYRFTQCLSVSRHHGRMYSQADYAPFFPYAEPEMPPHGRNQRLRFRAPVHQGPHALQLPGGRRIRVDIVGACNHLLWAAVYTRLTPDDTTHYRTNAVIP